MQLLDLPPEILIEVVIASMPDSFEALSLSNRYLYSLAEPFIDKHNLYKVKYKFLLVTLSPLVFKGPQPRHDLTPGIHPLQMLHDLGRDPFAALYIRHVQFDMSKITDVKSIERSKQLESQLGITHEDRPFRHIRPYLEATGRDVEAWQRGYRDGELWRVFMMLLSSLPNIRSLTVTPEWMDAFPTNVREDWYVLLDGLVRGVRKKDLRPALPRLVFIGQS